MLGISLRFPHFFLQMSMFKIQENEIVPADILILKTSDPKGICFIETKNLDGETNLKQKISPVDVFSYFQDEEMVFF